MSSDEQFNGEHKYDHYDAELERYVRIGNGKQRSKKEAELHTNQHDPCGHSRKILTKLINTDHKHKEAEGKK